MASLATPRPTRRRSTPGTPQSRPREANKPLWLERPSLFDRLKYRLGHPRFIEQAPDNEDREEEDEQ